MWVCCVIIKMQLNLSCVQITLIITGGKNLQYYINNTEFMRQQKNVINFSAMMCATIFSLKHITAISNSVIIFKTFHIY